MKVGARYLLMRRGPLIGREMIPRRIVSVASYHWTLESALDEAVRRRREFVQFWVVASGKPAHRKPVPA